jgi:DNA-binding NarL/FixJ family response regulator
MTVTRGAAAALDAPVRKSQIDIVIADDHPLVLDGFEHLCRPETDITIVSRATTAQDAISAVLTTRPSILLIDLHIGNESGLAVVRAIKDLPNTRVIIMAEVITEEDAIESLRLGVQGMILKSVPTGLVLKCIRKVHDGGRWLENVSSGRALDRLLQMSESRVRHPTGLSPRELEVARLVGGGLRNRAISQKLDISEATVKIHIHNIFAKMNVRSRVDLALKMQRQNIA